MLYLGFQVKCKTKGTKDALLMVLAQQHENCFVPFFSENVWFCIPIQDSQMNARPWWKVKLFVWEPVLFGTWDGVFTTCMINIFGVVLFLRTGWLVVSDILLL